MREAAIYDKEKDFRKWFEKNLSKFGITEIILSQEVCPDYVVRLNNGDIQKIEVELFAINFKYHSHSKEKVDRIIACYAKEKEIDGVPVDAANRLWLYDIQEVGLLEAEGPLSDDEISLLSAIANSGGISLLAFSNGIFAGDQQIYMRLPPDFIKKWPRGKIEDNIFNVISPQAKKFAKKYHHILIAAGLSEKACSSLQSLQKRGLIKISPISWIAAAYDGVTIQHDGWGPTEAHAKKEAWDLYGDEIRKRFWGGKKTITSPSKGTNGGLKT
jgi:hypothetical protein